MEGIFMEYVVVYPKAGMIVRDPNSKKIVPAEGMKVKLDKYWARRISDGDVVLKEVSENKPKTFEEGE